MWAFGVGGYIKPKVNTSRGFTLIEILLIVAVCVCMLGGALLSQKAFGGRFGWLSGAAVGFSLFPITCFIYDLSVKGIPIVPVCKNGQCKARDYSLERVGAHFEWVCQCGDHYQKIGRRFMLIGEQEELLPYMVWIPFRGWRRESSSSHAS